MDLDDDIQIIIEQIDIPQTEQFDRPPPPARPSVPVESESEDIADDVTLDEFNLDEFDAWDAPPPPPEGPRVKFIPYDDPPVPLRPIRPKYPEIAQEAGIEGTVVVQVFVDDKGRVKETIILKGIPNTGLDEAASDAIRNVRFRPAKQRERAVGVWISIPVNFRLKS
jgi:protein TonB